VSGTVEEAAGTGVVSLDTTGASLGDAAIGAGSATDVGSLVADARRGAVPTAEEGSLDPTDD
jgi:hypothetical protein